MPPIYKRVPLKFSCRGVSLRYPPDLLPQGLYPALNNVEVNGLGQLAVRPGISTYDANVFANSIHSLRRLQDGSSGTSSLIIGAGTELFTSASTVAIDTGYSGNPLSLVRMRPASSPRPYIYVGDSLKLRKVLVDGTNSQQGITPPSSPPSVARGTPNYTIIEAFEAAGTWTNSGTAGAIATAARFNTTITKILYDVGSTGWCSIFPAAITNFQQGALCILDAGGDNETVKVRQVFNAIQNTTIASILYDTGTSGLCSIVLTAQSTGLLPDAMLHLDSGGGADEYVRVLSVTQGVDGQVSFRCSTVNAQVAGRSVTGVASFRTYTVATIADTNTITGNYFSSTVTSGTGWLYVDYSAAVKNYATINNRAVQLSDYIHISIQTDNPANIVGGRLIFNLDPTFPTSPFTSIRNALYYNFTASSFQGVINNTITPTAAQQQAIQTDIINQNAIDSTSPQSTSPTSIQDQSSQDINTDVPLDFRPRQDFTGSSPIPPRIAGGLLANPTGAPISAQVTPGTSQWTELVFRVGDLARIGSDPSRSIGTVTGLILQLQVTANTTFIVDSWWIGGTYGPDSRQSIPYSIYQRYRSKATGARSNPSPATRMATDLQRERLVITPVASSDTQVDTIDIFAQGGELRSPTLILSTPNSASAVNFDSTDLADLTNETLRFDLFQPFPVSDIPRSGTVNVSGTSVQWVSGDTFNTSWQNGSEIVINNIPYTLYGSPSSTTRLQLTENAGNQTAVAFSLPEATIGGEPLRSTWGPDPLTGVMFGVGVDHSPGTLYWTNPNDPDSASDANAYEVCSPSEFLLGGFMYNGSSYVWSGQKLYRAIGSTSQDALGNSIVSYSTQEVPNFKGLFAFSSSTEGDVYWGVTQEGIYEASGGVPQSITDESLYPLFAHNGKVGTLTNGYYPIDFTVPSRIRLFYTRGALFFTYQDTQGTTQLWKYDRTLPIPGWFNRSTTDLQPYVVYGDELQGSTDVLMAGTTRRVYKLGQGTSDAGVVIGWNFNTPAFDMDDPRSQKLALDYMLDCDPASEALSVSLYGNNLGTLINTVSVTGIGRQQFPETAIQAGLNLYRNFGLYLSGSSSVGSPVFYEFEPNVLLQPYVALNFSNQYQSHQFTTYGHIRDGWIVYISTSVLLFTITVDGGTPYTFTIPSSGGLPKKLYLFDASITPPASGSFVRKGKLFLYSCTSTSPFVLFTEETIVMAKEWGSMGQYQPFRPFAGQTA